MSDLAIGGTGFCGLFLLIVGCLMDIYRLMQDKGGAVKLSGVQPRVETMISMTGVHKLIDLHREESAALLSFGGKKKGKPDA